MFALERQKRIMELLRENGSVMVNDLSRDFGVTLETVRRDLEKLEQMEQVRRTHGGAVLFEEIALDLSLEKRSGLNIEGKIAIAKKAEERNTGARGLRSIIEEVMTDIMFEIPSDEDIVSCIVHKECITDDVPPEIIKRTAKCGA